MTTFLNIPLDVRKIIYCWAETNEILRQVKYIHPEINENISLLLQDFNCSYQGPYEVSDALSPILLAAVMRDREWLTEFVQTTQHQSRSKRNRNGDIIMLSPRSGRNICIESIICSLLARLNDLGILILLNNVESPFNFGYLLMAEIGKNGNMNILRWALSVNRNEKQLNRKREERYLCAYAAYHSHLNILQLAKSEIELENLPTIAYQCAAYGGHLDILEWLYRSHWPKNNYVLVSEHEIAIGRRDNFEWSYKIEEVILEDPIYCLSTCC